MRIFLKLLNFLLLGNVPDCISHLVNFVAYSGNPKATLNTLQQTLPPTIFDLLIQVYASLEKKVRYKYWLGILYSSFITG